MPSSNRSIALPYADRFGAVAASLPGSDLPWLRDHAHGSARRISAARSCRRHGSNAGNTRTFIRSPRASFATAVPAPAIDKAPAVAPAIADALARLVFVNGVLQASDTGRLPKGVRLLSMPEAVTVDAEWLHRSSHRGEDR